MSGQDTASRWDVATFIYAILRLGCSMETINFPAIDPTSKTDDAKEHEYASRAYKPV